MTASTAVAAADYPRAECESCYAPIIWTVTVNAKPMPVDFEPANDGNVALSWMNGKVVATVLGVARQATRTPGTLRKSHFATCPDRDQWRRRR
ncbi:MAG: hypothetical protein HOV79_00310 [Hamadaea sp.]|nr:hypothetical protein [Hamadaea sp.]